MFINALKLSINEDTTCTLGGIFFAINIQNMLLAIITENKIKNQANYNERT
jgi:hypothetical protein